MDQAPSPPSAGTSGRCKSPWDAARMGSWQKFFQVWSIQPHEINHTPGATGVKRQKLLC